MNQSCTTSTPVGDETQRGLAKGIAGQNMSALPEKFTPGENDVICGRGRKAFSHVGNERFRKLVEKRLDEYSSAAAKLEKSYILSDIVCEVRRRSPNGGFVKKDSSSGRWYEVGDFLAREKTSQAFRDALHDQYKSSNTAKKKRRQAEQAEKLEQERQNSSRSLTFDPSGFNVNQNAVMQVRSFEPSQDTLLGALDADITASFAQKQGLGISAQHSARSVVDFSTTHGATTPKQASQAAAFNQSCPNFGWSPQEEVKKPIRTDPFIFEPEKREATHRPAEESMHHSSPHMYSSSMDYGSISRHATTQRGHRSASDIMEIDHAFPDRNVSGDIDSESFDDDMIMSPIGDGSPRKLFKSLSQLNYNYNGVPFG